MPWGGGRASSPALDRPRRTAAAGIVKITLPDSLERAALTTDHLHRSLPHAGGWMVEWIKKEGEPVRSGETVAELRGPGKKLPLASPVDGVLIRVFTRSGVLPPTRVLAHVAHFRSRTTIRRRLLQFRGGVLDALRGVFAARRSGRAGRQ